MSEKVFHCNVKREDGFLYFIDKNHNVARVRRGESHQEVVCKTDFTKEAGWMYYVDKQGDVSRSRMKSFREYAELRDITILEELQFTEFETNPDHKGWCTPMTKPTCTGKRKTFALNAKAHFQKRVHNDGDK